MITGNTIIKTAHDHGCKPVIFPNGALHIEGKVQSLQKIQREFWKQKYAPPLVTTLHNDGNLNEEVSPYLEIHPSVATRK